MNFGFYAISEGGNFMSSHDLFGSCICAFCQISFAFQYPSFTHGAVEEGGSTLFVSEVCEGVGMCNEFAAGADLLDQVNSDVSVGDLDTFDNFADHGVDFIVDYELSVVESDTEVEHTCTIDEVSATLGCQQSGEGFFMCGLSIGNFGVCLPTGYEARQVVELCQTSNGCADHAEFGATNGSGGVAHIHHGGGRSVDAGRTFLH